MSTKKEHDLTTMKITNSMMIAMLQETMTIHDRYLTMAWRGKYVHTPDTGNSQGCITLLTNDAQITCIKHNGQ